MSATHSKQIAGTRRSVDYELYGPLGSAEYKKNKAEGTTRVAAMQHDGESVEAFVQRAEFLRRVNGRKIESMSLIQSFSSDEFDPNRQEHIDRVNDMGYQLAKRLHPNSDALVITHVDGTGGHPHNHIKVINHDNTTGRALQQNRLHRDVAKVNDELMQENFLAVVEKSKHLDQSMYWEARREGVKITEFDQQLGDAIEASLLDERSTDEQKYREVLDEKGVQLVEKTYKIHASRDGTKAAHDSMGWAYKMKDETREKKRVRTRKASSLSSEFTHEGAQQFFEINREKINERNSRQAGPQRHGEGQAAAAVREPQLAVDTVDAVAAEPDVVEESPDLEPSIGRSSRNDDAGRGDDGDSVERPDGHEASAPRDQPLDAAGTSLRQQRDRVAAEQEREEGEAERAAAARPERTAAADQSEAGRAGAEGQRPKSARQRALEESKRRNERMFGTQRDRDEGRGLGD